VRKPLHVQNLLRALTRRALALSIVLCCLVVAGAAIWRYGALHSGAKTTNSDAEVASKSKRDGSTYVPTEAQWTSLETEPVANRVFRSEHVTEGKIAVNEASLSHHAKAMGG